MTSALGEKLHAKTLQTPPVEMLPLRKAFRARSDLFCRLYYAVGNYRVSDEIRDTCQTQPVVMARWTDQMIASNVMSML